MTDDHPSKDPKEPCADCDLEEIDSLTCTARKIERQAAVTTESLEVLKPRQEKFEAAKEAYTKAWNTAKADVDAATKKLEQLRKDIGCRLSAEAKECLEKQWEKVKAEIAACGGAKPGCREFDCTFDDTVKEGETQASLAGRIQVLRQQGAELAAYFDVLIERQTELPEAAADAKTKVETLASEAAADTEDKETLKLYARAIVLQWVLASVWAGFATIQDYLDCLCKTLTCLLKAWKAIVNLEGEKAERKCKEEAEEKRCKALRDDPVEVLLARYAEHCKHCKTTPGEGGTAAV
jgi:chromosome segregation ATPase